MTLNGDPRSSRPTFYESRRFVFKSGWERNSGEEGENTQDEKRLTPRPETKGQTLPPSAYFTRRSSAVLFHAAPAPSWQHTPEVTLFTRASEIIRPMPKIFTPEHNWSA